MHSTPAPVPMPRRVLLDALCGADLECRHCKGTGRIAVSSDRDRRVCPVCRGSGAQVKR